MQAPQLHTTGAISTQSVQDNFIAYFRIFADLPGIAYTEDDSVAWVACKGEPGSNILKAHFAADTIARIDATLEQVGKQVNAVDWLVWPDDRPANLGELLAQAGAASRQWMLYGKPGSQPGTWMVIDLASLAERGPVAADFRVEQVRCAEELEVWLEIGSRGFGGNDYSSFRAAYQRHGFGDDAQAIHFVGFAGDQPVTSSTLLIAGGSASAYNISTPVEFRRQGYGGAITHATLLAARARGFSHSWIWSSPTGKSVYQKLGFVITDFGIREYQWKKRG